MTNFFAFIRRVSREEAGQDMVEYVLIFALVSIVALAALNTTGPVIKGFWETIQTKVAAAFP